ncbi:MAG: DNA repair protein RecN [Xanthomonadales bacterium]|nr:DNA repair protein RecN [Xanthomonadales bacterium]
MLSHLNIRDFAIIPSLTLDFAPGFTAITGETGAGKSILVDALGLLLGQRSDSSWVRQGAERAELTAEFEITNNNGARRWLAETELNSEGQCLLRRRISANGRSRAWINGTPVTVQQMSELGTLLVEIHGQNEHIQLTNPARQIHLLDSSGDYQPLLAKTREAFDRWAGLKTEFAELEAAAALPPEEIDYLRFQLKELESQALAPAELEALETEHRVLAKGGSMARDLDLALGDLDEDDHGAIARTIRAQHALAPHRDLSPAIDESCKMLDEALINLQEASATVSQAREDIDLSPGRLQAVTAQMSELADLARKHRVEMEDLESVRERLEERLQAGEQFESRRATLEADCDEALREYQDAATALSGARTRHATELSREVTALMARLGMEGGRLEIHVNRRSDGKPAAQGDDRVELHVSANPGNEPGPLVKVASGGELSRISLALKTACSRGKSHRTQVFDEVDAGIGGDTANAVGQLLRKLSEDTQALCVTHLAQVAVCANQQIQVIKDTGTNTTSVDTAILGAQDRVDEIARMLSGRISDQSRQHAEELLKAADSGSNSVH